MTDILEAIDHPGRTEVILLHEDLIILNEALKALQKRLPKSDETRQIQEAVHKAVDIVNSEMDLSGKFKLTIPIIPTILSYDVKLGGTVRGKLTELWRKIKTSLGRGQQMPDDVS